MQIKLVLRAQLSLEMQQQRAEQVSLKFSKENMYDIIKAKEEFPANISRSARNEIRKYKATYYNNISVALIAVGVMLPLLEVLVRMMKLFADDVVSGKMGSAAIPPDVILITAASLGALIYARRFRARANWALLTIED